jgi:hypothetical protein
LFFVVSTIPSNGPSSSVAPFNVSVLRLHDSFVDPTL